MASPALLVSVILISITLSHAQDPTCENGFLAGGVCCALSCGTCGGPTCGSLPGGGAACCRGRIVASGVRCETSNAPCFIGNVTIITVPPVTAAPTIESSPTPTATATERPQQRSPIWKNIDDDITGALRPRHDACFVLANGKGYLIGGRGMRSMDIFDPKNRTWTTGPDPPTEMHHMQCVVFRARIFVPTSWFGRNPEQENTRVYIYNTRTMRWISRRGLPRRRRRAAAASVLVGKRIYVVGGHRGGPGPRARSLGWMDYFDIMSKRWVTNLPRLPIPRDHVGGALVNGQLCIAGGRDSGAQRFFAATVPSVFCFDFEANEWVQKQNIPTPRAGAATATLCDGRMMVAGGEGRSRNAFDEVEIFDGNSWTIGPSLVRARHGTGLAVTQNCRCGQVFIASGSGMRGGRPELSETEVYLPNGRDRICKKY